ncbi:mRNA-capping enzyme-like [Stylophora pistillata]|uniref:mRNA-capping enzyme-like n=1 Tax=Stylophora pistillata TaxID=50429 RepID=UPI000C050E5C|nr:mRNA-capping enzyme-like [Stylophora pistillata]
MRLGLIIDLTNTSRFYDKTAVEKTGIRHTKMQLEGHGETPSREQVQLFIKMCDSYFSHNPGELIGVHCTHGFNRTGFLIIAYLVERDDWR